VSSVEFDLPSSVWDWLAFHIYLGIRFAITLDFVEIASVGAKRFQKRSLHECMTSMLLTVMTMLVALLHQICFDRWTRP
jgi:hypothetical protein